MNKDKTGVKLEGIMAINPVNNKEVPVYLGDFVLGSYGTGAVMAVPTHDQRDFEYAKEHNLEIIQVIDCGDISEHAIEKTEYMGHDYKMMNSEEFDGMVVDEAREKISDMIEEAVKRRTGEETRKVILGYLQRGGAPTALDRMISTLMGVRVIELINDDENSKAVAYAENRVIEIDVQKAVDIKRQPDLELMEIAKALV